ncbi:uncharacterized protein TNCV_1286271 [Trichonephila clavipes]|uniref:Uncharacterized protein n=1 Tax=Trichonephila clavipes TaxID=2585209 RepID=A0A8X6VEX3_TRICX|nr:uncharacterized protein TNCV_1286271 [Trichonephila clavipes]
MLSAVPKGLGSNPIEGVDVCKSIVLLWHGDSLNSLRAASALMKLVEGQERWEAPDYLQGVLPQNWSGIELNLTIICMVLKAMDDDRRKNLAPCCDEFRGP